ncbi:DNA replication terminus site-binding protein [Pseudoalteromonas sp. MMG010]|uniref:DNA replication terminus site-binding protein n=1 Tax=Pseudoalteromonas sp. MMG010 TaxID=2822685 RepID=UPI001B3A3FB5|nr:DNA replication terminus site-binding protein [Pseudoalteromonas sp. MMG010]MBQ4833336.1 DNA replication terminus site-binding protein [Pseudoalteromonas sp. MMG010]
MVSKISLRSHFDLMTELSSLLIEELRGCEYSKAEFYQLPDIDANDEQTVPEFIKVNKLTGASAHESILNAYLNIYTKAGQSSKVLKRYPGVLVLKNPDTTAIKNRIMQVNQAKADFKACVLSIDNNDARFEAVHNAIPNLITLAAYRKIHCEVDSPFSVRFTWMHKHATKTLTKKLALEMLEKSASYNNPRMIDQHSWLALVEQEKMRVASLSEHEKLRIRRPTRVSPQVNVRYTAKQRYHVSAALPFILINPQPDVKIGELKHYEKPQNHPRKREYDFLVDRLYLEQV